MACTAAAGTARLPAYNSHHVALVPRIRCARRRRLVGVARGCTTGSCTTRSIRASATSTRRSAAPRPTPADSDRSAASRSRSSACCIFAFVLALIALCPRSAAARQNLAGYVFAVSTLGLAGVLYLAYASFFVLKTVCLLCVGTLRRHHRAVPTLGCGGKVSHDESSGRASRDLAHARSHAGGADRRRRLRRRRALAAVVIFPGALGVGRPPTAAAADGARAGRPRRRRLRAPGAAQMQQLEQYLAEQPRVPIARRQPMARAVVIVKFNDYQCPPCRQTFREYKPILAKLQQQYPGKIAFVTQDFPLDRSATPVSGGPHPAACEAAVAVRLAREKGKADAMEDWLFANQPTLTPATVEAGLQGRGGRHRFRRALPGDARTREGRHRPGRAAEGTRHADVLHERHAAARISAASSSRPPSQWELNRKVGAAQVALSMPRSKPRS